MVFNKSYLQFLGQIFQGEGSMDDLGGPIKIGIVIGEAVRSGIADLFFLMSFISLQLGIFNLLPIPALDGGHISCCWWKIQQRAFEHYYAGTYTDDWFFCTNFFNGFCDWNDLMSLL
jgi:membrane-associated protease RseP (regulator of RpoE activity)